MQLRSPVRVLLGFASLVPLISAFVPLPSSFVQTPSEHSAFADVTYMNRSVPVAYLDSWFLVMIVSSVVLAITFCVLMWRSANPSADLKPVWVVLLFTLSPVSLPVFWYAYLRKETMPTSSNSPEHARGQ
jgi:hypothetical protein